MAGKENKAKYPNQKNQDGRKVPEIDPKRRKELDKLVTGRGAKPVPGSQKWAEEQAKKGKRKK